MNGRETFAKCDVIAFKLSSMLAMLLYATNEHSLTYLVLATFVVCLAGKSRMVARGSSSRRPCLGHLTVG